MYLHVPGIKPSSLLFLGDCVNHEAILGYGMRCLKPCQDQDILIGILMY